MYRFVAFTITMVCALALLPGGAFAADYYVATNGGDTNAGTLAQPFATIQKADDEELDVAYEPVEVFVSPDGDFRLRPDSPALKQGFVPLDLSKAGLRNEPWFEFEDSRFFRNTVDNQSKTYYDSVGWPLKMKEEEE